MSATLYSNSPTHNEPSGQGFIGHRSMKTVNGRNVNDAIKRRKSPKRRLGRNHRVSDTPGSTGGSVGGVGNGAGSY